MAHLLEKVGFFIFSQCQVLLVVKQIDQELQVEEAINHNGQLVSDLKEPTDFMKLPNMSLA